MPKHIQKYVEGELASYSVNKRTLIRAKQNVYAEQRTSSYAAMPHHATYGSSAVEHKVMYLMSDRNIARLENAVAAIEDVLSELPEEYRRLVEYRYFKAYSVERVAMELNICVRNFYNWRDKALYFFAIRFGLI